MLPEVFMDANAILHSAKTILVIDFPSPDVPETLARSLFRTVVKGGPGPKDYSLYTVERGSVLVLKVGSPPAHADLVYVHRPVAELAGIVEQARSLGAKTLWMQSGLAKAGVKDPKGCWMPEEESREARRIAEGAGLTFLSEPYIADVARATSHPA